jgi:aspartate--ammonia ligase
VEFDVREMKDNAQVVQSLAKWKRLALHKYGFPVGEGLYTDMNAIRRDEAMDNLHSIYVDQWDWEKVISRETRNLDTLKETVIKYLEAHKTACIMQIGDGAPPLRPGAIPPGTPHPTPL